LSRGPTTSQGPIQTPIWLPAVADALESDAIKKVLHGIPRPAGFYQGQAVMAPVYDSKTGKPKKGRNGELVMAPVVVREFPTALHSLLLKGWRRNVTRIRWSTRGRGGSRCRLGVECWCFR